MALSGEAEMHSPRKFPKREPQPFFTEKPGFSELT